MPMIFPLLLLPVLLVASFAGEACAQRARREEPIRSTRVETYKTIGDVELNVYIFEPEGHQASDSRPAIMFFFGGGWRNGSPRQFEQQCRYLASRGMVAMSAEYRIASKHQTKIRESVLDGRSAMRWARENAARLGIDPERLAAGGGSAGGHVAATTALIENVNEPTDKLEISPRPDLLVLFNPALSLAPIEGVDESEKTRQLMNPGRAGCDPVLISPVHHVREGLPPTILFFGTEDFLLEHAKEYTRRAEQAGNSCELVLYEGQKHGFFNFRSNGGESFLETVEAMDRFLVAQGWLTGAGNVRQWLAEQ